MKAENFDFLYKNKTEREYYTRHLNDGSLEVAAICFVGIVVCAILSVVYKIFTTF